MTAPSTPESVNFKLNSEGLFIYQGPQVTRSDTKDLIPQVHLSPKQTRELLDYLRAFLPLVNLPE